MRDVTMGDRRHNTILIKIGGSLLNYDYDVIKEVIKKIIQLSLSVRVIIMIGSGPLGEYYKRITQRLKISTRKEEVSGDGKWWNDKSIWTEIQKINLQILAIGIAKEAQNYRQQGTEVRVTLVGKDEHPQSSCEKDSKETSPGDEYNWDKNISWKDLRSILEEEDTEREDSHGGIFLCLPQEDFLEQKWEKYKGEYKNNSIEHELLDKVSPQKSDMKAVIYASDLGIATVIILTNVDGIYSEDPLIHNDALRFNVLFCDLPTERPKNGKDKSEILNKETCVNRGVAHLISLGKVENVYVTSHRLFSKIDFSEKDTTSITTQIRDFFIKNGTWLLKNMRTQS